jgi:ATP synthase protein I
MPTETERLFPILWPVSSMGERETSVIQQPDSRSALSIGLDWGTRITTIGLEFALPAFIGFGLDRWWNTIPWMTVVGAFLGLAIGMTHVLRLAYELPGSSRRNTGNKSGPSKSINDPAHRT